MKRTEYTIGTTMRTVISLLLVLLMAAILMGSDGTAGQAGDFMRYGATARSLAMGGAYSAIASGGDALIYNPGGLGRMERWEFDIMHSQLYLDTRVDYIAFTMPIKKLGSIGLAVLNMGSTAFDGRDAFNTPTGDFDVGASSFLLGYGRWVWGKRFQVGIAGKFNQIAVADGSKMGLGGFDVGLITKNFMHRKMRAALAVQNIGAGDIAGDKLPMVVRLGLAYRPLRPLYITADGEMVSGGAIVPRIGAEFKLSRAAILRAGYSGNEVTFGLGLVLDRLFSGTIAGTYPTIDYAGAAMNPIENNFTRFSLAVMGRERVSMADLDKAENPCANLTAFESLLDKDGAVGAKANIVFGDCYFKFESVDAPLSAEPALADIYSYFKEAYIGRYGSDWSNAIVTDEDAKKIFSQRTHYMFAETRMAKGIDDETKKLVKQLILTGGDSTQYDSRLQFDLAYCYETLGQTDSAIALYKTIAKLENNKPERYLAMLKLGDLLRDEDKDKALEYLNSVVEDYSLGFYTDKGVRVSYPMFPKYKDNAIVDDALLEMGDIYFTKGETERALASYIDIVLFYPDLDKVVVKTAIDKAAQCYEKLGNKEASDALRAKLDKV